MQFIQIILNSLPLIGAYSLATFGIVLIFRTSATTNFAQGLIGALGAYVATQFCIYVFGNVHLWLAVVIAAIICFVFGIFVDWGIIKRGKNVNPAQKQIITMGLLMVLTAVLPPLFRRVTVDNAALPYYLMGNFTFAGGQLYMAKYQVVSVIIAVVVLAAVFLALRLTKWGLSVRATASNETVGQMMGINTTMVSAVTWGISGAMVALAACSFCGTNVTVSMMGNVQVYGFLSCVLGGLSSFTAPMVGTVIIPLLINIFGVITSQWNYALVFVVVIILIIFFPNGLFGKKMVKKV